MQVQGTAFRAIATLLAVAGGTAAAAGTATAATSIKPGSITVSPAAPQAGGPLQVEVAVRNPGRRVAKRLSYTLHLSKDTKLGKGDVRLSQPATLTTLKARKKGEATAKLRLPTSVKPGRYRLLACTVVRRRAACRASKAFTVRKRAATPDTPFSGPLTPPSLVGAAGETAPPAGAAPAAPAPGTTPAPGAPPQPQPQPQPNPQPDPQPNPNNPGPPPPPPANPGTNVPPPPDPGAGPKVVDGMAVPPSDTSTPVSVAESVEFLYTGDDPVQKGVQADAIDPARVVVIQGQVIDRQSRPVPGVKVTVLNENELGRTETRDGGSYDIAVNGGGAVTLRFEKDGFLQVQRQLELPEQDIVDVNPVTLSRPDPVAGTIDPNAAAPFGLARGPVEEDRDGRRQSTLLFPKGTAATMRFRDGTTRPLAGPWTVRATEYTVGEDGWTAMPADIASNTAYNYAVEFTIDQAEAAGAEHVEFSKPIINYVENVIGAKVGAGMPTGYYDRIDGQWKASDDGRIVEVLAEPGGVATLDVDGDGAADTDAKLAELGITTDELRRVSELYAPGTELLRVPVPHFSPWDHNSGVGPVEGSKMRPLPEFQWKDPKGDCEISLFSEVACERQTVRETLPIQGTPYRLVHQNDRTPGWLADNTISIPVTPTAASLAAPLVGIRVNVSIMGRTIASGFYCDPSRLDPRLRFVCDDAEPLTQGIRIDATWDGLDAYGRRVNGRPTATVEMGQIFPSQNYGSRDKAERAFNEAVGDIPMVSVRAECAQVAQVTVVSGGSNGSRPRATQTPPPPCVFEYTQSRRRTLGVYDPTPQGLGGWTLDRAHALDTSDDSLVLGSGRTIRGETLGRTARRIIGAAGANREDNNFPGVDGRPANEVDVDYLIDVTHNPKGGFYVVNSPCYFGNDGGLIEVDADGIARMIAPRSRCRGTETEDYDSDKDDPNDPETLDGNTPAVAAGPDGAAYVIVHDTSADGRQTSATLVRRVKRGEPNRTIAGKPFTTAPAVGQRGDGRPAKDAAIVNAEAITVSSDGTVYVAEEGVRIRRIGTDGMIDAVSGVAGATIPARDPRLIEGVPARDVLFSDVTDLDVGPDGSIYVADGSYDVVVAIGTDGVARRVVGTGTGGHDLDRAPTEARIEGPTGVSVAEDGVVHVLVNPPATLRLPSTKYVLKVTDTRLVPVAGRTRGECDWGMPADGTPAAATCLESFGQRGLEVLPDGDLVVGHSRYWILQFGSAFPETPEAEDVVASPDGTEAYLLAGGRHVATRDTLTGVITDRFTYDARGRLQTAADRDGRTTRFERGADGRLTHIVAPGGQITRIATDAAGRLTAVGDAADRVHGIAYDAGGRITGFVRPSGGRSRFEYDALGRLSRAIGAGGRDVRFTRSEGAASSTVTARSSLGEEVEYRTSVDEEGLRVREIRRSGGLVERIEERPDGSVARRAPSGHVEELSTQPDERFPNATVPAESVTRTPAGKTRRVRFQRYLDLADPTKPFSVRQFSVNVEELVPDGSYTRPRRLRRTTFRGKTESAPASVTYTDADGETGRRTLDDKGRVLMSDPDGYGPFDPTTATYDARGRLSELRRGSERLTYAYDGRDRVTSVRDGLGRERQLGYDAADQLTSRRLPSGATWTSSYDADGNLAALDTPGGGRHTLTWAPDGLLERFRRPVGAEQRWLWDADRRLTGRVRGGNGRDETITYTAARKTDAVTATGGATRYSYSETSPGEVSRAVREQADGPDVRVDRTLDGELVTRIEQRTGGTVTNETPALTWDLTFDDTLDLTRRTFTAGGTTVADDLVRDDRGLVVQDGPLTATRSDDGGHITSLSDGAGLRSDRTYTAGGRLATRTDRGGTTPVQVNRQALTWDAAGRVTERRERIGTGAERVHRYTHDADGHLLTVSVDGTVVERYAYDQRGNRTSAQHGSAPAEATAYAGGDDVTAIGATAVRHDDLGRLVQRGGDTFAYDAQGNLVRATVGGTTVRYAYDDLGRRVRREEGTVVEQYMYDPGRPLQVRHVVVGDQVTSLRYDDLQTVVAMERGGKRYVVGTDHVGTPQVLADAATGAVVATYRRDAFGRPLPGGTGTERVPLGFAGGLQDPVTGFVRFGLRDYDPRTGRFITPDPSLFAGSPMNLFTYGDGDPVTNIDPTGLANCGGGSLYGGLGGGVSFCRNTNDQNGKQEFSVCVEVGVGAGGSVEAGWSNGGVDATGLSIFAEGGVEAGIAAGGGGVSIDLSNDPCTVFSGASAKATVGLGPVATEASINTKGETTLTSKIGAGAQVKGGMKGCVAW